MHVMPRYVLHNLLDVPLQCKQAGTAVERELTPGVCSCLPCAATMYMTYPVIHASLISVPDLLAVCTSFAHGRVQTPAAGSGRSALAGHEAASGAEPTGARGRLALVRRHWPRHAWRPVLQNPPQVRCAAYRYWYTQCEVMCMPGIQHTHQVSFCRPQRSRRHNAGACGHQRRHQWRAERGA